jgi:hypothetical protein
MSSGGLLRAWWLAFTAVASYEHAYALVRVHGEAGWTGRLVPLTDVTWSGTGMMACPVGVLSRRRASRGTCWRGPAASRRTAVGAALGADAIDPVPVAPRWLNWRRPPLAWGEETFYSLPVGNDPKPGRFP